MIFLSAYLIIIFDECEIERGISNRTIVMQLKCLRGSCIELRKERYVLIHDTLLDFLCCYFGKRFPETINSDRFELGFLEYKTYSRGMK
jgi:hypothetical protein